MPDNFPPFASSTRPLVDFRVFDSSTVSRKAHIISLGCPKNLVDTERHVAVLVSQGYELTDDQEEADLLLVNTCGFIDEAKEESIDTILDLVNSKGDDQKLVVAGCLVDRYPSQLKKEIPEVDLWINLENFSGQGEQLANLAPATLPDGFRPIQIERLGEIPAIPWASFPRVRLTPPHTAYLKISEGCDHSCGFCAIPSFRGPHRSVPLEALVREASCLVADGAKELTLIGQDLISYGKDVSSDRKVGLRNLLEALDQIEGLDWIRLLYTYPTRLADELFWAYGHLENLVPYLDLPLQHLSDPVLERMRRGTPYNMIRDHVARIRDSVSDLVLRSTCIVGYPGEMEDDFDLLRVRFEELQVDHLGVFRYSDEEGTIAERLSEKIPPQVAERRRVEMTEWAAAHCQGRALKRLQSEVEVLVDSSCLPPVDLFPNVDPSGRWWQGRWYGQAPEIDGNVFLRGEAIELGQKVPVRLEQVCYPDYLGRLSTG